MSPRSKTHRSVLLIDLQSLTELSGFADLRDFQTAHRQWVKQALENGLLMRDDRWSKSIAVGRLAFIDKVKSELGVRATHRDEVEADGSYSLREPGGSLQFRICR